MFLTRDDHEAVMRMAQYIVRLEGHKGVLTDPIDVAAMLYKFINELRPGGHLDEISTANVTIRRVRWKHNCGDDSEETLDGFEVLVGVGELFDDMSDSDAAHMVFDVIDLEAGESARHLDG